MARATWGCADRSVSRQAVPRDSAGTPGALRVSVKNGTFSLFSPPCPLLTVPLLHRLPKVLKVNKQPLCSTLTRLLISKPFASAPCPVLTPGTTILERARGPEPPLGSSVPGPYTRWDQPRCRQHGPFLPSPLDFPEPQGLGILGNSTLSPCLWEL